MEVPRLTGFLRRFGHVSAKEDRLVDEDEAREAKNNREALEKRRTEKSNRAENSGKTWARVTDVAKKQDDGGKSLKEFRAKTRELVGGAEAAPNLVDDAAVALFRELFDAAKNSNENEGGSRAFTHRMHAKVKEVVGPGVTFAQAEGLYRIVEAMATDTSNDQFETALSIGGGEKSKKKAPFGRNVEYKPPKSQSIEDALPAESEQLLSDVYSSALGDFSLRNEITFDLQARTLSEAVGAKMAAAAGAVSKRDLQWLENKISGYYGDELPAGMSVPEFSLTLIQLLQSKRSSDDLQTELFDLVGFDRFELIQSLLEHREELVREYAANKNTLKQEIMSAAANAAGQDLMPQRPQFGCQVLVQSEEERLLRKQVRKEEKKINRILGKSGGGPQDEDEFQEQAVNFDPVDLRTKRQAALANAMSQPILRERQEARQHYEAPVYPYVFDSMAKTKTAAGFIQGVKMALPTGFLRKDDKDFEEVSIPASENAPVEIGRNLVPISSLDEVGQASFAGMKSLNRIQSVVCDSAYRTNENLLVCAPTGAGKTNVAMLCITQTIKQHIVNGIIKKDSFKIVYVAPMKALAAEMTANFGKRLAPLGISVRELTGDMQLTKSEIASTQMLVTTPEKWDVVTRKPGDVSLSQLVRLLIIDEVHLLHGDRGPVVEALVARTLRMVESSQTVIRVVGLSATLPNYIDVAGFLRVNPYVGLFFFDGRFRPVPLAQTFIGVKEIRPMAQLNKMNEVCYDKVVEFLKKGKQVMVFVHARNSTAKTGMVLKEMAQNRGDATVFEPEDSPQLGMARSSMAKSRNRQLAELFDCGIGIHHAGMLRSDRNLVEKLFAQGHIKVLCCTATLAWGVNLPAHAVIIKGTEIYDAKRGSFVDVGILDVLQIFGRAGRPQFDTSGHGTIITSHDKLAHYLSLLTNQFPIESNFVEHLADNLNAEISLGTVTNVEEAVTWLSYTYLHVRMRKNPLVYGVTYAELRDDPELLGKRRAIVIDAARRLDKTRMIRYDERTGYLHPTDLGRTASQFYIKHDTIEVFNEMMKQVMKEDEILDMLSRAREFEQLKVRDDEMEELDNLTHDNCEVRVAGGSENVHGKVNILMQSHISRGRVNSFSLISDQHYVVQNGSRIARALFEIALRKNWPLLAGRILKFAKTIERQMWDFESPLKQHPGIKFEILDKLERRNFTLDRLREMDPKEIGQMIHHVRAGADVKKAAMEIPLVELEATIQPITRTVLRVKLSVKPNFRWNDRVHGTNASEPFWIWVEDPENSHIYHHEYFMLSKKQVRSNESQDIVFTIPIFEPLPSQYYIRAISDRWIGSETYCAISFQHLILPERHPPHTDLLDLQPLPVTALNNAAYEMLYNFSHFNPIQTQIFHTLYHTDKNFLLGAPTGSGKTIAAEIAMFKVFRDRPEAKVVYIAPLKALVRERIKDWKVRFERQLGKKVVELTGDVTPDVNAIKESAVIVTTPEKWDGISRSWQTRNYVQSVALIVIDEIHLLGEDRGPVLEVIVSRTNFISSHTSRTLRIIGLSTALANARDLADWLGIGSVGLYNFRPSVRPVPLEVHIAGFPGKHYCPRMATMNKPTYQAIEQHSASKPALVFVSSRRQTRLTALDLIAFLAGSDNPKKWLHMEEREMENLTAATKDQNLKLFLSFGIGIHHAGLTERDRKTVEELFVNQKIQVMIATATVAWGVNFPAHLVVIKGTEYFDGKQKRYVDMPITDVLQMMGRAGRPQYDDHGVACVLVHDVKKHFYKKFLYEPFPVESSLHNVLPDHLNAEVVAGTIQTRQEAMDYLTWTYFFRRLVQNPTYYGLEGVDESNLNQYLSDTIDQALNILANSCCLDFEEDGNGVYSTTLGRIASYYYLSHDTVSHFEESLSASTDDTELLKVLTDCREFAEMPVRHNEDLLNTELAKQCPIELNPYAMDSPHQKTHLLLQSHFCRNQLPNTDYGTDTKSVMDQAIRILQAMIDIVADAGWLSTTLRVQTLLQAIVQGSWPQESSLMALPHTDQFVVTSFRKAGIDCLPELMHAKGGYERVAKILQDDLAVDQIEDLYQAVLKYPVIGLSLALKSPSGKTVEVRGHHRNKKETGSEKRWLEVAMDTEYTLSVGVKRANSSRDNKAFAPRFPKPKDEGWFLVLGCVEDNELLALKRSAVHGRSAHHQLTFFTPEKPGRVVYTLYVMSDAYRGLDQQYDICLDVVEGLEETSADEYEDDEARFALLAKEMERLNNTSKEPPPPSEAYATLGARPKKRT